MSDGSGKLWGLPRRWEEVALTQASDSLLFSASLMEPWGFEPQIQPCHGRVIPFHYGPGIVVLVQKSTPPGGRVKTRAQRVSRQQLNGILPPRVRKNRRETRERVWTHAAIPPPPTTTGMTLTPCHPRRCGSRRGHCVRRCGTSGRG